MVVSGGTVSVVLLIACTQIHLVNVFVDIIVRDCVINSHYNLILARKKYDVYSQAKKSDLSNKAELSTKARSVNVAKVIGSVSAEFQVTFSAKISFLQLKFQCIATGK